MPLCPMHALTPPIKSTKWRGSLKAFLGLTSTAMLKVSWFSFFPIHNQEENRISEMLKRFNLPWLKTKFPITAGGTQLRPSFGGFLFHTLLGVIPLYDYFISMQGYPSDPPSSLHKNKPKNGVFKFTSPPKFKHQRQKKRIENLGTKSLFL